MSFNGKRSPIFIFFPVENTFKKGKILIYFADCMSYIFIALKIQSLEKYINETVSPHPILQQEP